MVANPSVLVQEDDSLLLYYRGHRDKGIGVARAASWEGPYVRVGPAANQTTIVSYQVCLAAKGEGLWWSGLVPDTIAPPIHVPLQPRGVPYDFRASRVWRLVSPEHGTKSLHPFVRPYRSVKKVPFLRWVPQTASVLFVPIATAYCPLSTAHCLFPMVYGPWLVVPLSNIHFP